MIPTLTALALFPWSLVVLAAVALARVLKPKPALVPRLRLYKNLGPVDEAPRGAQLLEGCHLVRRLQVTGYRGRALVGQYVGPRLVSK